MVEKEAVQALAAKYHKAPAQIALKYVLEKGSLIMTRSTNPEHMRQDMALFGWPSRWRGPRSAGGQFQLFRVAWPHVKSGRDRTRQSSRRL